jgi:hypothetical protein
VANPYGVLLVPLESPQQVGVHLGGFVLYRRIVQELLNLTSFCH